MSGQTKNETGLTVIVPCYNEEENIEACLKSVTWADEILLVDSFSTDRTLEIARRYATRILQHEYVNSAAQKNWAIPKASHDWILVLDSDERVSPSLEREITSLLAQGPKMQGYWIYRDNFLFGKKIRNSGWGRDSVLRLFEKTSASYEIKRVHAEIQLAKTGRLQHRLEHHSVLSIDRWVEKINRYSSWKAQDKFEQGSRFPVMQLICRPFFRFVKDYIFRLGLCDGWRGFLIASMSSCAELIMSAKLVQLLYYKQPS